MAAPVLDSVIPSLSAAKAGLMKGDSIVSVAGVATGSPDAFVDEVTLQSIKADRGRSHCVKAKHKS